MDLPFSCTPNTSFLMPPQIIKGNYHTVSLCTFIIIIFERINHHLELLQLNVTPFFVVITCFDINNIHWTSLCIIYTCNIHEANNRQGLETSCETYINPSPFGWCYMWIHTANTEKDKKIEKLNRNRKKKIWMNSWFINEREIQIRNKYNSYIPSSLLYSAFWWKNGNNEKGNI